VGFADLHNHLLWGLDDGPEEADESVALARALVKAGFTDVAATPHARPGFPAAEPADARRAELQQRLDAEGVPLKLHPGAENRFEPEFMEAAEAGRARALGAGRYVLVEPPFEQPLPAVLELVFRLRLKGLVPLIAHPERCAEFVGRPQRAEEVVQRGARLQIEVGSLAGVYGKAARKTCQQLLDAGLAHVASTDLHRLNKSEGILVDGLSTLRKSVGEAAFARLLDENPRRVLAGEELP
jgi:protein-tyrosine phosphatase